MQDCHIVCLTGFMGSGKSTVGRALASQLAWHFVDLDAQIERHTGLAISQIFERQGEVIFREIEHECLVRVLGWAAEHDSRLVLSLGGGTLVQPRNAALLPEYDAAHTQGAGSKIAVIWLDCGMELLLQRCVLMGDRPLFRDEESFRKLYEERLPYYEQAGYRVDSSLEPSRVVEQIMKLEIFDRRVVRVVAANTITRKK